MACVYLHRRKSDGQPFYVGVGKHKNRANHKSNRTDFWKKIVSKKIYQYSVDGEYLNSYCSITEASKITGANRSNISICANPNNTRKTTSGGFKRSYEKLDRI